MDQGYRMDIFQDSASKRVTDREGRGRPMVSR